MKLGLVVPRYGTEVVGGTEHWLRNLCEHLVEMKGWAVEVFTTCALSASTWADHYPSATTEIHGVTVHRLAASSGRDTRYLEMIPKLRDHWEDFTPEEASTYVESAGPVCPAVIERAVASDCDLVAVTPYLYWPAVVGVPRLGRRVVFHGAAHDEPELRLPQMQGVFSSVGGFSFNSYAERDLVEKTFRVGHLPGAVIGNAVVEGSGDAALARRRLGLAPEEPFVLCLGKVERSKGSHALARMWELYASTAGRPVPRLVFVGPVHEELEASPHVLTAGLQPEEVKWGALGGCTFLISPSAWESFSLVVVEAWLAGKAVLVNGRCEPTVEHCRRSGGGVWFEQFADFAVACDRLLTEDGLRQRLAQRGEAYGRREFAWPAVVDRYEDLAGRILRRWAPPGGPTARRHGI